MGLASVIAALFTATDLLWASLPYAAPAAQPVSNGSQLWQQGVHRFRRPVVRRDVM